MSRHVPDRRRPLAASLLGLALLAWGTAVDAWWPLALGMSALSLATWWATELRPEETS